MDSSSPSYPSDNPAQEPAALLRRIRRSGFGHFARQIYPAAKLQKLSVWAHTTCPNRDGTLGRGGCTYCLNQSFTPAYALERTSVTEQLLRGREFFARKYRSMQYLAYFQSYTSTYASVEALRRQYQEALSVPDVVGLVVSTRPDCLPDELLQLLSGYALHHPVLLELGVESTLDATLQRINRGHTYAQAADAVRRAAQAGLHTGVHLILGLPGEGEEDVAHHARQISRLPVELVKLHQLQILKGTPMAREYALHPEHFTPLSASAYARLCLSFMRHLREDICIDRFVSQSPPHLVVAPRWNIKNYQFIPLLERLAVGEVGAIAQGE